MFGIPLSIYLYPLEISPKIICALIGSKSCFYEAIRLQAPDFYCVIVDEGAA